MISCADFREQVWAAPNLTTASLAAVTVHYFRCPDCNAWGKNLDLPRPDDNALQRLWDDPESSAILLAAGLKLRVPAKEG